MTPEQAYRFAVLLLWIAAALMAFVVIDLATVRW